MLKVVTAFTLAHSITLSLAALQVISLPSRLVESTIALSVVVAALNNLRGTIERRRWVMAFVFGLIHGFGFASVLADLGLPQGALVLALVGFNLGVELGQMAHRRRLRSDRLLAAHHALLPPRRAAGRLGAGRPGRRLVVHPAGFRYPEPVLITP